MSNENGSDYIHTVGRKDPPFLFHYGEGFLRRRLPAGSSVIYAKESLPGLPDRRAAIQHALDNPEGTEPFDAHLKPGMRVTVAFDDVSLPLPKMPRPDVRQDVIEIVIERLERAGITDIELICAICLHRRCTPAELRHMVGPEVFRRFYPDRLYNHDAEDPDGVAHLGKTDHGEDVELNKRAVDSDLLVYVNINMAAMDGGHKSVPVGLATYKSVRHHHNARTMLHESSYMDPPRSDFHRSCERMGALVRKHVNLFTIETSVNGDTFHAMLGYLQKRESTWSLFDRAGFHVGRVGLKLLPGLLRRKAYGFLPSAYQVTGVFAGETEAVHAKTLASVHDQQVVPVPGPFDIVIFALPSIGPYNVNSILNPILVHCLGMGYFFNFYRHNPLVRRGGVVVLMHPIENKFHMAHHPSYYDFFEDLLPQTRDPQELERRFEESYATNERYIDMYRNSYAYHGVHPFYMWYWAAHGTAHVDRIIAVHPQSVAAAQRLGYSIAPSLDRALDLAKDIVGTDASIGYLHCPPVIMCDVS